MTPTVDSTLNGNVVCPANRIHINTHISESFTINPCTSQYQRYALKSSLYLIWFQCPHTAHMSDQMIPFPNMPIEQNFSSSRYSVISLQHHLLMSLHTVLPWPGQNGDQTLDSQKSSQKTRFSILPETRNIYFWILWNCISVSTKSITLSLWHFVDSPKAFFLFLNKYLRGFDTTRG